jgi:D-glycero-D-manno-heptose 1,7-bisphosphate phosphatase
VAKARAIFLDRDGTIIRDVGYPRDPKAVELLPGVVDALGRARALGFRLIIISNQSGVGRGLIAPAEARAVQDRVEELFASEGVTFDGVYFCFHAPDDACDCRKPKPAMLLRAAEELSLDLPASLMIGDKDSDVEAGLAAGCSAMAFGGPILGQWQDLIPWIISQDDARARNG